MLGPPKPLRLAEPIAVSLEDLVPPTNFYRHLDARLDLTFVREWFRDLYPERGRHSIDPVVFFKLQLIMFFEGIRSERKLVETASLNFAHRWYLGYALVEDLPNHSNLTRIRQRFGITIFERFFERIGDLCQESELVWGAELYVDATKVRAEPDVDSLVARFYCEAKTHLAGVFADDRDQTDESPDDPQGIPPDEAVPTPGNGTTDRRRTSAHGVCSRSGGWTHTDPRSAPASARPTFE
jgi:transposase